MLASEYQCSISLMSRFLKVPPAGVDDKCLLTKVLYFLGKMLKSPCAEMVLADSVDAAAQVLLSILHEQSDDCRHRNIHNGGDGVSLSLAMETMGFLSALLRRLDPTDMARLASRFKAVDILTDFSFFVFSSDTSLARSHYLRQTCLSCLLSYSTLPSLTSIASSETLSQFIHLLVQIVGSFQKTFANFADGNSFTYKDSAAYKWTALCLRNLSRTVITIDSQHPWIWGEHWLYENDIDWLLNFLNDDEKIVQKFGLGILANLILLCVFMLCPF